MKPQNNPKKTLISFIMLISLILIGMIGYSNLLNITLLEALYITIITISTVGSRSIDPLTPSTMLFTTFLIFWGVALVGYAFSSILMMLIEGRIQSVWRGRMAGNRISKLKNHYVLCGCGETGESIVEELKKNRVEFVVIEGRIEKARELMAAGILTIHGDATEEEILHEANITSAKGMISTMSTDTDNIVAVLTARTLNKSLYIISKALDKNAPQKLKIAGADKTLHITSIGGKRMAALLLHPTIITFLDVVTKMGDEEFNLEAVEVKGSSDLCNKKLRDAAIPSKTGLIVFAIQQHTDGKMVYNPSSDYEIWPGDSLIVMGNDDQIESLNRLAR